MFHFSNFYWYLIEQNLLVFVHVCSRLKLDVIIWLHKDSIMLDHAGFESTVILTILDWALQLTVAVFETSVNEVWDNGFHAPYLGKILPPPLCSSKPGEGVKLGLRRDMYRFLDLDLIALLNHSLPPSNLDQMSQESPALSKHPWQILRR